MLPEDDCVIETCRSVLNGTQREYFHVIHNQSHAAQHTTHNHNQAHSKHSTTHTQKHDTLPQHQS
jgi:hypothetical protein